jgi:glyoxylase-like metal-dependent hydrolase (beta-lactamase superfamily II)
MFTVHRMITKKGALAVAAALCALPAALGAQAADRAAASPAPTGPAHASYRRARPVLDAAIAAHGGEARLRAVRDLSYAMRGTRYMAYQSRAFRPPWDTQRWEQRVAFDVRGRRVRLDNVSRYPRDFVFAGRQVATDSGVVFFDPTRAGMGDVMTRGGREQATSLRGAIRRGFPPLLLLDALDRAPSLRSLGEVREAGRTYDVITIADTEAGMLTLLVDRRTRHLGRLEFLRDDFAEGDQSVQIAWDGYQRVNGVVVPTRRTERRNGLPFRDDTLEVTIDGGLADSVFATVPGYQEEPASVGPEDEAVRKMGENVWLAQQLPGGNRVMFVAFRDHVLVLETPNNSATGEAVKAAVARTVPGKPVRYATFSHPHDDHGAGLRGWVADGVTIVTTPPARHFVEEVVRSSRTLRPDALARAPRAPVIETFTGTRVFTDGATTVELHDIGPTSHAESMVMAYLPRERLIFQGDLVIMPDHGEVPAANTLTREFARYIEERGLQVDRIAGVHGRVITMEDLRTMVAKGPVGAP